MQRQMLKSKIHRATVTEANLHYQGSLTLGYALAEAADILPYEFVHITNIANGAHWVTYVIRDDEHPDTVCLNGSAARHFHPGDLVIIMAYAYLSDDELPGLYPRVVFVDGKNRLTETLKGETPFTR
ncbi:Aspartate 1-decarboxylase [Candidatus Hydrogenisulfobacillus filiaventi]|uniref:Aspartate 1-decarboxylase n=1 Tax=Candidatus Hydrogenisulfobacillus filiaventi TaxID=2707344 RepID=A0A6F8ZDQ3_9FIRM|nr:Aspartate 1-decarboxylase [Candidatus Hydrogenisulfobacillus filiaventi]